MAFPEIFQLLTACPVNCSFWAEVFSGDASAVYSETQKTVKLSHDGEPWTPTSLKLGPTPTSAIEMLGTGFPNYHDKTRESQCVYVFFYIQNNQANVASIKNQV